MKINITGDCYAVGDIHGDALVLVDVLSSYDIKNCTLILLGDVGIWRYRDYKRYMILDNAAKERNIMIYALRGNHDNPAFFYKPEVQSPIAKRFWDKFTNFKVIPDLTRITINGANGIVIGGACSIDRSVRRSFISEYRRYGNLYKLNDWWEGEILPNTNGINETFDFILSHTGPRPPKCPPLTRDNCVFFERDHFLNDYINSENQRLEEIREQFKPKKWWFGHFHINNAFDYKNSKCYAVDILNLSPLYL